MDINLILKALKNHAKEEVRIHKEVFGKTKGNLKTLVKKHLNDTMSIHRDFWTELKKAAKSK